MRAVQTPIGPSDLANKGRDLLQALMDEKNVSARRLSRQSGVEDTTILRVLKMQQIPSLDVLDRLLAGLGYEVSIEITPNPLLIPRPQERP